MPSLDDHGKLAAAVIPFYVPILAASAVVVCRHGFGRNTGWIYLLIFSIIRILGGALLVAAQLVRPVNENLYIAASILELAGLSPLLLATLGFVRTVASSAYEEDATMTRFFRLLYLLGTAAFVVSIYGGANSVSDDPSALKTSTTLRHVGSILFAVLYIFLVLVHAMCWTDVNTLNRHRRMLLTGISLALPFLGVRMAYSILSSYSGSPTPGSTSAHSSLSRFNLINGAWWIYLVMGLLMEYIVVCIYTIIGLKTPTQRDGDYTTQPGVSQRSTQFHAIHVPAGQWRGYRR